MCTVGGRAVYVWSDTYRSGYSTFIMGFVCECVCVWTEERERKRERERERERKRNWDPSI